MRRSVAHALLAIALVAVGLRLLPLATYLYWGADFGEYHAVLRGLLREGHISTEYEGWGVTYPYFPGMFFVQGAPPILGGLDAPTVLSLLVPILGAFAVVPVFLLAVRVTGEAKVGLFAATFVAVAMPHAYSTSHTAPSTLGDLLTFAGLLVFVRLPRERTAVVPVILVSAALVLTHHLTTYFLIVMVLVSIVLRGLLRPRPAPPRQIVGFGVLIGAAFVFWFAYATTFRDFILRDVRVNPWWLLPAAFPVGLAVLAILVRARRRFVWRYRPGVPRLRRLLALYAGTLAFILGLVSFGVAYAVPGTGIVLPAAALIIFAPLYILLAFAAAGRRFLDFTRDGPVVSGAFLALVLSAGFGSVAAPHVIIPYRHVEFLLPFLAIFAGVGFVRMLDLGSLRPRSRAAAVAVVGALLAGNALVAIPSPDVFAGWNEGVRPVAVDAAYWSRFYVEGLLAADHRASSIAFGFGGIDATWDATRLPFFAEDYASARDGLFGVRSPSGVRDVAYVWLDDDMERGVQTVPFESAFPMTPSAIAKFSDAPFVKVFDNGYARIFWHGSR
jgi:hypothetical protein